MVVAAAFELSAEERAELQALVEEANVKPLREATAPQLHSTHYSSSTSNMLGVRERLHFDAACGGAAWQVELASCTTDYVEQDERDALWNVHVSGVVRLRWGTSVQEETGGGLGVHMCRTMAEQLASENCLIDGAKRLAKRFACSLGMPAQRSIAQQMQSQCRRQRAAASAT